MEGAIIIFTTKITLPKWPMGFAPSINLIKVYEIWAYQLLDFLLCYKIQGGLLYFDTSNSVIANYAKHEKASHKA